MSEDAISNSSKTNWERVDALTDDEIDTSDVPALSEGFFGRAHWRVPAPSLTVLVQVDPETFAWHQDQGDTADDEMAAALRIYAEAHKAPQGRRKAA